MIYIKNYEFYKDIAKKAYNIFEKSNYYDICREIENEKSFFVIMIIHIII